MRQTLLFLEDFDHNSGFNLTVCRSDAGIAHESSQRANAIIQRDDDPAVIVERLRRLADVVEMMR
jgi:hypothetical protein